MCFGSDGGRHQLRLNQTMADKKVAAAMVAAATRRDI
jgi:hypothetical protein